MFVSKFLYKCYHTVLNLSLTQFFFTQPIFQSILIVKSEWVAREF